MRIPARLRERLQREPVFRDEWLDGKPRPWTEDSRQLSMAALFGRLSSDPQTRFGIKNYAGSIGRLVLRDVGKEMNLSKKENAEILNRMRNDGYFNEKFWTAMLLRGPGYFRDYAQEIFGGIKHAFSEAGVPPDETLAKARAFVEIFRKRAGSLSKKPHFYFNRYDRRYGRALQPEVGFEDFFASLPRRNLTAFIERQANVERGAWRVSKAEKILQLRDQPYDASKVKEFVLTNSRGEKLGVVSKRLHPIKSGTAEKEFETSLILDALGIPTPTPVGVVKDRGNTYFFWEKLKAIKRFPSKFNAQVEKQKRDIKAKLVSYGIKHRDIADRNFVVTVEKGKLKVWLIDLERFEIPNAIRKKLK